MSECLFCRIVSGDIPSRRIFEDDRTIVFEDINPQAPVHLLLIPRRHIGGLNDLDESTASLAGSLVLLARRLAAERGLTDSGYRLVVNSGVDAGQTVPHLHFHLLGGRKLAWPPG